MTKLRIALLALTLAACAPAQDGPDTVVRQLYAPYLVAGAHPPGILTQDAVLTPSLKSEIDRAATYGNLLESPVIDYDPVVGAQDWDIKSVAVSEVEHDSESARIVARFDNMGATTEIPYAMQLINGAWLIDDIGTGDESLRAVITASLRPAGDPAAMQAPVQAIYERYAAAVKPVDPLYQWAPLTDDLRQRLHAGAEAAAHGGAAVLDFDPVVDGKGLGVSPVQYEVAASSVIVRFDKDGEPKLLVYDLVDEDGAWKIADIRAPGHWSLEQKLGEAGVP